MEMEEHGPKRRQGKQTGWLVGAAVLLLLAALVWFLGQKDRPEKENPSGGVAPEAAEQLNASSTITLSGGGVWLILCVLSMIAGLVLILRRK